MSCLPEELYLEILLRIPVRSTYVCKCVCRSWFQLISDPNFLKSHLNPNLIFSCYEKMKGQIIYSMNYSSLISSSRTDDLYDNCVELDFPFQCYHPNKIYNNVRLLGSCNGLVCLWSSMGLFCFWNPVTTEYKTIPEPPNYNLIAEWTFGYDCKVDDYVLVVVGRFYTRQMSVFVYTLRSDSWKSIRTEPYNLSSYGYGAFAKGTFHWLVENQDQGFSEGKGTVILISLDITNGKFVELQLPKEASENSNSFMHVGVLEGCLSILVNVFGVRWEVWVMRNYGVQESWTKHCDITNSKIVKDPYLRLRLVGSIKNGEILLKSPENLVLYDKVHGIARECPLSGPKIYVYVESQVSLNSGTFVKLHCK